MGSLEAKAIVSTTVMQIGASCAMMTMAAIAPLVATALNVPTSLIGSYTGVLYVGSAAAASTCGSVLRRFGAIHVTQVALLFIAFGLLLGCIPNLLPISLGAFCLGFGYGLMTPASSDLLARYVPPERIGLVFSIKQTGVPLGFALAGCLTPSIAQTFGWQIGLALMACACILLAFAGIGVRNDLDSYADPTVRFSMAAVFSSLRLVIQSRALKRITLICFTYNGMQLCVLTFIVSFFVEARGTALVFAGLILSVANLGGMFGRPFWGWISDRLANPPRLLGFLGLGSASIVLVLTALPATTAPEVYLGCAFLLGCTSIGWNGVALALMARAAPSGQAGAATGGTLFFAFFGSVLFPMLFGFIEQATLSYEIGYWMMCSCNILIGFWLLIANKQAFQRE